MESAKQPSVRLRHILETIDGILLATKGMSQQELSNSFLAVRALERSIQIISEAAKELPADLRAEEPDVPWRDLIGIGNLLRHEYYRIRAADLWDILHRHLPLLRTAIVRLLADIGD